MAPTHFAKIRLAPASFLSQTATEVESIPWAEHCSSIRSRTERTRVLRCCRGQKNAHCDAYSCSDVRQAGRGPGTWKPRRPPKSTNLGLAWLVALVEPKWLRSDTHRWGATVWRTTAVWNIYVYIYISIFREQKLSSCGLGSANEANGSFVQTGCCRTST